MSLCERRHIPLPDLEVLSCGQPSLVLRQVPDFALHDWPSLHLGEKLYSTSNANVEIQDMISAQHCVDCISSLRTKRIKTLRQVLISNRQDSVCLAVNWDLLREGDLHIELVPLDGRAILLRVHHKGVFFLASVFAHEDILHRFAMATFVDWETAALQLCELTGLLHLNDIAD